MDVPKSNEQIGLTTPEGISAMSGWPFSGQPVRKNSVFLRTSLIIGVCIHIACFLNGGGVIV